MTISEFKKEAEKLGRIVKSVRTYKKRHGRGYLIQYCAVLNEKTISNPQTRQFPSMSLGGILQEWEINMGK